MKWEVKPLGDVCEIRNGSTPSKGNPAFWENGTIPWFTIDDIREQGRLITSTRQKITEAALSGTSVKLLPKNSVLLCCTASVGEFAITGIPLTTNQQFNGLVVKEPKKLDANFLMHFVSTLKDELLGMSGKTTIDFIPISRLRDVTVPLPPLPEQQRIVGKLDAAFAALGEAQALVERNRANARELFESYLNGVFERKGDGWVEKELGTICEVKDGTHDSPRYLDEGVPFVTQKNIKKDGLSLEDTRFISLSDHESFYRRSNAAFGDILISMIGANRGMACIVDQETVFSIKNVGLVKHNDSINQDLLLAYLKSSIAMEFVKSRSKGGAQEFIGLTELRKFPIHYPHRAEQDSLASMFAELREETKHLEATYQQKLLELAVLKRAILGSAFKGEL